MLHVQRFFGTGRNIPRIGWLESVTSSRFDLVWFGGLFLQRESRAPVSRLVSNKS